MKGGRCEGWHVFEEMQALKKKYRDSLSAQDAAMIAAAGGGGKKGGGKGKQKKGAGKGANGGCNTCGSMDHWQRDCPHAGPKPPDIALVVNEPQPAQAQPKHKPPPQPNLVGNGGGREGLYGVDEGCYSLHETIRHQGSKTKRTPNTIDLSDWLARLTDNLENAYEPCYRVNKPLNPAAY